MKHGAESSSSTCQASGEDCSGLPKPLRWSTKHERFNSSALPKQIVCTDKAQSKTNKRKTYPTSTQSEKRSRREYQPQTWSPSCSWDGGMSTLPNLDYFGDLEPYGLDSWSSANPQMCLPPFGIPMLEQGQNLSRPFDEGLSTGTEPTRVSHEAIAKTGSSPTDKIRHTGDQTADEGDPAETSMLQIFYRLSSPRSVPGFCDQDLINHYFDDVCSIYSCFDSEFNQFRAMVEQSWSSSPTISFAIQSMALGHLANYYPYLGPLGLSKRSQAWKSLQHDLRKLQMGQQSTTQLLLGLLLLGLSSSWHVVSNSGQQFLMIARTIMQTRLQHKPAVGGRDTVDDVFFQDAIMYWEAMASFIDPIPFTPFSGPGHRLEVLMDLNSGRKKELVKPHPWTGIAVEVFFALAEIGRIMRRRSERVSSRPRHGKDDGKWAADLESFLFSLEMPHKENFEGSVNEVEAGNLVCLGNVYRQLGLLELYRAYPDLLRSRETKTNKADGTPQSALELPNDCQEQADFPNVRLTSIAVQTLSTIEPIKITSGVCRLLPLVLLSCGSQLRFHEKGSESEIQDSTHQSVVVTNRYFVEARMLVLSRKYPQKPILQMIDILKVVWERLDEGSANAHWMDIIHEKGWQTMMG